MRSLMIEAGRRFGVLARKYDPADPGTWTRKQLQALWGDWRAQVIPEDIQRKRGSQLLTVLPPATWTIPDWMAFASEFKGVEEVVRWPLYHYKAYAAAGYTTRQFFDEAEGAGRQFTNNKSIGQLPGGESQIVVSIAVYANPDQADSFVAPTSTQPVGPGEWYDVLTEASWLEFIVGDKEYMVGAPLIMFPTGFGFNNAIGGNAATQISVGYLNNGSADNRAKFNMDPPVAILPTRNFRVTCRWAVAQAVTTAGIFGVVLDGWKVRVPA